MERADIGLEVSVKDRTEICYSSGEYNTSGSDVESYGHHGDSGSDW